MEISTPAGKYTLPHELRIERSRAGKPARLFIDGEPFPYSTADGFHLTVDRTSMPGVTLTLVADKVTVLDQISEDKDEAAEDRADDHG